MLHIARATEGHVELTVSAVGLGERDDEAIKLLLCAYALAGLLRQEARAPAKGHGHDGRETMYHRIKLWANAKVTGAQVRKEAVSDARFVKAHNDHGRQRARLNVGGLGVHDGLDDAGL